MATEVTVSQRARYTNVVYARSHELLADEPAEAGGADAGPSPWELVLAGMGACTSITVQMYAERKGWKIEGVEVHLARGDGGGVSMQVDVLGELDEQQRRRLEAIAVRCPVVKGVQAGLQVDKHVTVHNP